MEKKKNYIGISVFGYENKVKYKVNVSTKCQIFLKKNMLIYYH